MVTSLAFLLLVLICCFSNAHAPHNVMPDQPDHTISYLGLSTTKNYYPRDNYSTVNPQNRPARSKQSQFAQVEPK
eukprot:scaffold171630_cov34-Attheya_sp.AAC.1